ncbi:2-phospho-L-lactate guanylyltransferase [Frankia sp. Cppng1_Ct_nod]|uniref:2-phospho-L-lactate guanylyltransferase n=1 Tax=Frankia sp. Cppng1_Ct_nod TaxID=2897162 RepID=UPI001F5EF570|nr:2-phospho-L-lactate guanylyltransferase [Frankia sp. Cppng1_Ct_nod]
MTTGAGWVVVVPIKLLAAAKSRLAHPDRTALALAMAQDTVAAASGIDRDVVAAVIVVTNDDEARTRMVHLRGVDQSTEGTCGDRDTHPHVIVVPDVPDAGLNAALAHGAAVAVHRWPGTGVAALSADLAALRPSELQAALLAAPSRGRALVSDATGTGTVLLAAAPGTPLRPQFGPASRAAHVGSGARDLTAQLGESVRGLRRDVDTLDDLREAVSLGVGPRTRQVLAAGPSAAGPSAAG